MIAINLRPNRIHYYHEDLYLTVCDKEFILDTYYFWNNDFGNLPIYKLDKKFFLKGFLEKESKNFIWLTEEADNLISIDFSDEYIGAFKIAIRGADAEIKYGYVYNLEGKIIRRTDGGVYTNLASREFEVDIICRVNTQLLSSFFELQFFDPLVN